MKCQPNRDYVSDDVVQTPQPLAYAIARHFSVSGDVLEPCKGEGAFIRAFRKQPDVRMIEWCEITKGKDFVGRLGKHKAYIGNGCELAIRHFDFVCTNPPWSLIRPFLQRSMSIAGNVVFLMTVNHAWTKARIRDVREAGFGIKEIALCDMPQSFPQSGFQFGAVHWQKGWTGDIKQSRIEP